MPAPTTSREASSSQILQKQKTILLYNLSAVIPGPAGAAVDHHHQGIEDIAAGEEKATQQRHRPDRLHPVPK